MQNFAINGGALNGDPEVWIDASSASVVVQAAGEGMRGIVLSGAAQVHVDTSLSLAFMAKLSGVAGVTIGASGVLTYGVSLVGSAPVHVGFSGFGLRWVMIEGTSPTVVNLNGDIAVVPSISATFTMLLGASMDLQVATGQKLEGILPIVFAAGFDAHVAKSFGLGGYAPVQMAGIGKGNLIIASPPGAAQVRLKAEGDARFGAKLSLEGTAEIGIYARGYLESWHYVYAEGSAAIEIMARAEKHGTPNIPGYYVEAPAMRALRVAEEARRFTVPAERRN